MAVFKNGLVTEYENRLLEIMEGLNVTLLEAMVIDLYDNKVNVESIIYVTDYLEDNLNCDMAKVNFYMQVLSGYMPDFELKNKKQPKALE
jgi:hypothetical protein